MLSKTVMNAIALVVTAVWALSFLAQFVPVLEYKPDPQINLIFGALVGGAFALPSLLGGKDTPGGRHRKTDNQPAEDEAS